MPMSEQERREYREDLGRIFDGIDQIRGDVRVMREEVSKKVSEATLERKLAEHFALCRSQSTVIKERAGGLATVLTPFVKTALWIGLAVGGALAGFLSGGSL